VSRAVVCSAVAALCLAAACHRPVRPGDPLRGLTREQRDRFARGKAVFERTFKPETGLGPLFNSTSCGECHENPKTGGRGDEVEVHATAFRAKWCDQALGIDQEPFPPSATARAMRTTVTVFARGLLDLVPEEDILAYADPDDRNHDGISGRPNRSLDGRLGRFGRKAFVPTLAEFNAGAFVAEMGITNPAQPTEENIGGKPIPPGVDPVPDPEITQAALDLTDDFVRFLARPTPTRLGRKGRRGRKLFAEIGCAACHVPTLRTGPSPIHALDRKEFPAYTDLLLHDMGPDLADICLGRATPSEFRTEPLIDMRHAKTFLHDGRATTLEQAIAAHGGEGSGARDRFGALAPAERKALVAFLESL